MDKARDKHRREGKLAISLEGGAHRGCVGGAFSKEHRCQGLKSSLTSTASAPGCVLPPHGSLQNTDSTFTTSPWLPIVHKRKSKLLSMCTNPCCRSCLYHSTPLPQCLCPIPRSPHTSFIHTPAGPCTCCPRSGNTLSPLPHLANS